MKKKLMTLTASMMVATMVFGTGLTTYAAGDQSSYGKEVVTTTPGGVNVYGCYVDMWDNYTVNFPTEYLMAIDAAGITNEMSDYEKCVHINDYLRAVIAYGQPDAAYRGSDPGLRAIRGGKGICSDYAEAFQTMTSMLGMESYIYGSSSINHAWNAVVIDGVRYYVDVTWNDNLNANKYLMDVELSNEHNVSDIRIGGTSTCGWEEVAKREERKDDLIYYIIYKYGPVKSDMLNVFLADDWISKELSELGLTLIPNGRGGLVYAPLQN